jgi:hypothetical protein
MGVSPTCRDVNEEDSLARLDSNPLQGNLHGSLLDNAMLESQVGSLWPTNFLVFLKDDVFEAS